METVVAVLVDGVIYASWLFIMAAGLTIIYGVMRILNMAHGSLYALGAYAAATFAGAWLNGGHAPLGSYLMLGLAALAGWPGPRPPIDRRLVPLPYCGHANCPALFPHALFIILAGRGE